MSPPASNDGAALHFNVLPAGDAYVLIVHFNYVAFPLVPYSRTSDDIS